MVYEYEGDRLLSLSQLLRVEATRRDLFFMADELSRKISAKRDIDACLADFERQMREGR